MRRLRYSVVSVIAAAVMLASAIPASAAVVVKARCNFFDPRRVTIAKGGTVRWRGVCGTHTVTAWSNNWSKDTVIAAGTSTKKTFRRKGIFKYRCRFHSHISDGVCSGMCGRVRVT